MKSDTTLQDSWKEQAGVAAAEQVKDGMVIGIGTGSTARFMIQALAKRIQAGLRIVGAVPSSEASKELASSLTIPLTTLDTHPELDLYLDGADEIDPQLDLIKGAGGALLREKIVTSCAHRFIVIADVSKQVPHLGHRYPVPVEVVPFGITPVYKHLEALGASVKQRYLAGVPFITDNGNVILDCTFPQGITDPQRLNARMHEIVGVVETGLFLGMASQVIIGGPEGVKMLP